MNKFDYLKGEIDTVSFNEGYNGLKDQMSIDIEEFDINSNKAVSLLSIGGNEYGISQWVSPKRTRSEPFARIYKTLSKHKRITIIPIQKDEGKDGDLDKITASTLAWMNLMNIYVILAYYVTAEKKEKSSKEKITNQKFDNEFIKNKIIEVTSFQSDAHHWNNKEFEENYLCIMNKSKLSYQKISENLGVQVHANQYKLEESFCLKEFIMKSNIKSENASKREADVIHELEVLGKGTIKPIFKIKNFYEGEYFLTADESWFEDDKLIIQESKNTTKSVLPSNGEIMDALFKTILFCNIDRLADDKDNEYKFEVRVKLLSSKVKKTIIFPVDKCKIIEYSNESGIDLKILNFINSVSINRNKYTDNQFKVVIANNGN